MPSERSRYLKNRPSPPVNFLNFKKLLIEESPERLSSLLMIAGQKFKPLRNALYIICGAKQFEQFADHKLLEETLLFAVKLDDFVSYDNAGAYSIVTDELVDFFKKNKKGNKLDQKLLKILERVIPQLESSAELLQDENSWFAAVDELRALT